MCLFSTFNLTRVLVKSVLICCERSQVICKKFFEAGCDAYSNDILPCYGDLPGRHILGDSRDVLYSRHWDLVIAHPPCTYLCAVSAVRLYPQVGNIDLDRLELLREAASFFMFFYNYTLSPICVENPRPLRIAKLPPYSQVISPSSFGHNYSKRTCLWLRDLPPLLPTHAEYLHPISYTRKFSNQTVRSRSFEGIADAMVQQWLPLI